MKTILFSIIIVVGLTVTAFAETTIVTAPQVIPEIKDPPTNST